MNTRSEIKGEKPGAPWNFAGGLMMGLAVGVIVGLIQGDLLDGLGFGLIIGLALGAAFERRDQFMQYPPHRARQVIITVLLFLGALFAWSTWIDDVIKPELRLAFTLAPVIAFLLLVLAVGTAIACLDELQRRIQTEAIAIGFGLTAMIVFSVGLLNEIGLGQPNWLFVGLVMILSWGIGKAWTLWKYR